MTKFAPSGQIRRYGLGVVFSVNAYAPFVFQNGGELLDRGGSCAIGSKASSEALCFFSRLYGLLGVCSHKFGDPRSALASLLSGGLLAMLLGDADDIKFLMEDAPSSSWGFCRIPGKLNHASSVSIQGWGVSSSSARPQEAFQAIAALAQAQAGRLAPKSMRGFPAFRPLDAGVPEKFLEILEEGVFSIQSSSPRAFKGFHTSLTAALSQRIALSQELCLEFQRRIDALL